MTALCTLADLKVFRGEDDVNLGTSLDDVFKVFIEATSKYAEQHCHRILMQRIHSEYFDGNNDASGMYYLKEPDSHVPLDTTLPFLLYKVGESAPFTETLIASTEYRVFDDGMILYPACFACGRRNYRAIYYPGWDCTGWDTFDIGGSLTFGVPEDVRKAIAQQSQLNLLKAAGKYGQARLGLTSKGLIETEQISTFVTGIESEVAEILKQYVKVHV